MKSKYCLITILVLLLQACNQPTINSSNELDMHQQLANKYYEQDDYNNAIGALTKLIELEPMNGEHYYRRAYSCSQLELPEFKIEDYKKSAQLGYKEYESYYSLGVIYSSIELDDSLAIFYFNKALEIEPESLEVKLMLQNIQTENE